MNNIFTEYKKINIKNIDINDSQYSFSFPDCSDNLLSSIKEKGLLTPPVLHENKIVCGRRRILSCKKLGYNNIYCGILNQNIKPLNAFHINIQDNINSRNLNLFEKSVIINKLRINFNLDRKNIVTEYFPVLSIPENIDFLDKYEWISSLPDHTKKNILKKNIPLKAIDITRKWQNKERTNILDIVFSFGLGINNTCAILNLLNDIHIKYKTPVSKPFQSQEWENISHKNITNYQKGIKLKNLLIKTHQPKYYEFINEINYLLNNLHLSKNILIDKNKLFSWENNTFDIKISVKNKKDLEHAIKSLKNFKDSKSLNKIINLINI